MKKILVSIILLLLFCSCSSKDSLQIKINNDNFIYNNFKMKKFLEAKYIPSGKCTYFRTVSLDSALIELCDFDIYKEDIHIQVTLSDPPFNMKDIKKHNVFRTILTWNNNALYSFMIDGQECIGLSAEELLEQFNGERFNQYIEFVVKKYRFRFEYVNNQLISIKWLADAVQMYL